MSCSIAALTNLPRPQISETAVVALPSEQWGQKVAAVVVLHPSAQTAGRNGKPWGAMDMRRALRDRLAAYKVPQEMKVLESIPRNAMGKGKSFLLVISVSVSPPLFFSKSFSVIAVIFERVAIVETC
jgi:acyl-CoA synthetase (AMP-forming)/AMP-acid ligase II